MTNTAMDTHKLKIFAYLSANLILSIVIVLLNKWVYQEVGFPNLTLTLIHFVVTSIGLVIASRVFRLFKVKSLPIIKLIPLSLCFCGYVVFTNLSLEYNTVGTYQISKTLTMPTVMLIQTYVYEKRFSTQVKITLVCICSFNHRIKSINVVVLFFNIDTYHSWCLNEFNIRCKVQCAWFYIRYDRSSRHVCVSNPDWS